MCCHTPAAPARAACAAVGPHCARAAQLVVNLEEDRAAAATATARATAAAVGRDHAVSEQVNRLDVDVAATVAAASTFTLEAGCGGVIQRAKVV